jgi:hypothetical protein
MHHAKMVPWCNRAKIRGNLHHLHHVSIDVVQWCKRIDPKNGAIV